MYPYRLLFLLFLCFSRTFAGQIKRFRREFRKQRLLSDLWIDQSKDDDGKQTPPCPCPNPDDCRPISSEIGAPPVRTSGEIYGFAGGKGDSGRPYNWTHISTVAWAANDTLMCEAHRHGARAVLAPPSFNLTLMTILEDEERNEYIQNWVQKTLAMVQARYRDGVVFDFEGPMMRNSPMGQAYVDLINATRIAFHSLSSSSLQVTTCVAWSPNGIDGRYFPHEQLSAVSDLLYVMDYDTQSQIIQGPCIANANAPFYGTRQGLLQFLELGIDPQKLILGVPWYGYQYQCLPGTQPNDRFCPIRLVPFRGVGCSDAAGYEIPYSKLLQEYSNQTSIELVQTGGMRRDAYMDASFFNFIVNDTAIKQSWMDDPSSLRRKYSYARSTKLAGVGPFTFSDLDPVSQPEESRWMWSAFDAFLEADTTDGLEDA